MARQRRKVIANVTTEEKVTDRKRWIALYVLCVGVLMIVLDATVVNVALPAIQSDLIAEPAHAGEMERTEREAGSAREYVQELSAL
jgi:hypothetical protein